jgi:hypothetical protein
MSNEFSRVASDRFWSGQRCPCRMEPFHRALYGVKRAVATADEVRAALQHIARLADELGSPFRRAAQILGDGALTGPAAVALDRGMADRHSAVQRSFTSAFDAVARLAPAPGVAPPRLAAVPAAARLSGGDVRGGDPGKLAALDAELRRTGRALDTAAGALGSITARVGLGAGSGRPVAAAGAWATAQATDVRRRGDELLRADAGVGFALGTMAAALGGPPTVADESALLARARTGDQVALAQLAALQRSYADPHLPARIAAWWKSLSATDRQRILKAAPGRLGALDGLPATIRDQANRLFLAGEKTRLANRLAALRANPDGHRDEIGDLAGKLKGITDIEGRLALGGKAGRPPMFLLGFDTETIGHAIVSVGNPDTADNVVTFVPGFSTRLSKVGNDIDRALTLWDWADGYDSTRSTASIYWLGYDAPQGLDVAAADRAEAGAARLDSFLQGLQAARSVPMSAHSTLLGHSYGSLVSGRAAVHFGTPIANNIVFVGSPGVGVQRASQLGIPVGHVWAGRSPEDPIPFAPPLNPMKWVDDHSVRYGNDPTSPEFGSTRFSVDHQPVKEAHSNYWERGSESLKNLARIVDGQYGQVKLTPASPTPSSRTTPEPMPSLPVQAPPLIPKSPLIPDAGE